MERIILISVIIICVLIICVYDFLNKILREENRDLEEENDELINQPLRFQNEQLRSDLELKTELARTFEQAYDKLKNK